MTPLPSSTHIVCGPVGLRTTLALTVLFYAILAKLGFMLIEVLG